MNIRILNYLYTKSCYLVIRIHFGIKLNIFDKIHLWNYIHLDKIMNIINKFHFVIHSQSHIKNLKFNKLINQLRYHYHKLTKIVNIRYRLNNILQDKFISKQQVQLYNFIIDFRYYSFFRRRRNSHQLFKDCIKRYILISLHL